MRLGFSLILVGFIVSGPYGAAQQPEENLPPAYRGVSVHVDGVYIPPIAGAPFSAKVEIRTEVSMPDGTRATRHTLNEIGRDSSGRIHNERRALVPETFHGTPRLISVRVFDPSTRTVTCYEPLTHVVTQSLLPPSPNGRPLKPPMPAGAKMQDLGMTTLNNIEVKGLRYTYTVPLRVSGADQPVQVTDEYWYSEDLQLNILVRHDNPLTGVQTVAITSLERQEPPATFFAPPPGYKIVDVTPPEQPASAAHAGSSR